MATRGNDLLDKTVTYLMTTYFITGRTNCVTSVRNSELYLRIRMFRSLILWLITDPASLFYFDFCLKTKPTYMWVSIEKLYHPRTEYTYLLNDHGDSTTWFRRVKRLSTLSFSKVNKRLSRQENTSNSLPYHIKSLAYFEIIDLKTFIKFFINLYNIN